MRPSRRKPGCTAISRTCFSSFRAWIAGVGRVDTTLIMAKTLLKIFSRDRQAIFFTLFFPITFMVIFGIASAGGEDTIEIGIVDNASNAFSAKFVDTLEGNRRLSVDC